MLEIPLTQGLSTHIDDADFPLVSQFKWTTHRTGPRTPQLIYASRRLWDATRKRSGKTIFLHRFLMNPPLGYDVDHINGNGLDNHRVNLRVCTRQQNNGNQTPKRHTSRFKGVYRPSGRRSWIARIMVNYRPIHLGSFDTEEAAAQAYQKAAEQHFGAFAYHTRSTA